ncbi:MAG: sulfurtransferase [Xanthomonadales bacterium]|nr:sulfurtransferase [Xanthomonadales bacterium]
MSQKILLSARDVFAEQKRRTCIVVDCRFVLSDPGSGYKDYLKAHIPGAIYAHLDNDLSGPVTSSSGRHPLPDADSFAAFLARSGWQPGIKIVAYDEADGSIAARLWWLMKYFGHNAALLDGGLSAWQSAGYELESGQVPVAVAVPVQLNKRNDLVVHTRSVLESLGSDDMVLVDVRASERFSGEFEPIDPVAGHIPGSVNYPFQLNLSSNGKFKSIHEIQKGLQTLPAGPEANDKVYMCGSGVTACHTIFAAELVGFYGSKLYAGSWSEWIRNPSRPAESKAG